MTFARAAVNPPDTSQRLAARERPAGQPVMFQEWRDLLFLHWEFPVAMIQQTLPAGLFVDAYEGQAWLGIVPFFMCRVRPRRFPVVPGISNFLELNLRTYVHDAAGVPGVWFYSLDANQWLAVKIARRLFHLPYEHADMTATRSAGGAINYRSSRQGANVSCHYAYAPGEELGPAAPDSLEFFLVERYRLYSSGRDRLFRGAVAHEPYPLCRAEVTAWDDHLLALDGFTPTGRAPDHTIMSRGVQVTVFPLDGLESLGRPNPASFSPSAGFLHPDHADVVDEGVALGVFPDLAEHLVEELFRSGRRVAADRGAELILVEEGAGGILHLEQPVGEERHEIARVIDRTEVAYSAFAKIPMAGPGAFARGLGAIDPAANDPRDLGDDRGDERRADQPADRRDDRGIDP